MRNFQAHRSTARESDWNTVHRASWILAAQFAWGVAVVGSLAAPASGQSDSAAERVIAVEITLTDEEFTALEPLPAFGGGPAAFGGPAPPAPSQPTDRETQSNLFGMRFPWVDAKIRLTDSNEERQRATAADASSYSFCRLRYDGDFTYMLAGASPKRPLAIELLDEREINGATAFHLHTMQFDNTMLRERMAAEMYRALEVPVPTVVHVQVDFIVQGEPRFIGLYSAVEAIDQAFLQRRVSPDVQLIGKMTGLQALHAGNATVPGVPLFYGPPQHVQDSERRLNDLLELISRASDQEFEEQVGLLVDLDSCLRYLAAITLTSNVVGFSNIGVNDYLIYDTSNDKFAFVASEFETALGNAALVGTPEQLADLSIVHPYAEACPLVDRLFASDSLRKRFLSIVDEAISSQLELAKLFSRLETLNVAVSVERERDQEEAQERARQQAVNVQGFGGGPAIGRVQAGGSTPMDLREFLSQRWRSVRRQLAEGAGGFQPSLPAFGGFGGGGGFGGAPGPGRRTGSQTPITDAQFAAEVLVPEGFAATLFARAPEVNYPVAIAAEPSGAIYVASDEQGSLGTASNGGKVLRCVDRDLDGVLDSVTTFCRADHVRGVVYRANSVWVCHPPYLSVFHDDDGDGIADRSQQLVNGLTTDLVDTRGGDHTTNGIRMGVDGWLYIGVGDYGVPGAMGVDGSRVVLRGGGIMRVRPDGTELELYASGLRNPFDLAIDPWMNLFTRDNTNDGGGWDTRVSQLFQSAEYGYPRLFANFSDEIMPPLGVYGSGGGSGGLFIEDPAWPESHNNALYTGDWGRSGVFHHPLTAVEASFTTSQASYAQVPRTTGMDIDANGLLYVASWWSGEASVYVGPHVGFVARIAPSNVRPVSFPKLEELGTEALIERLRVPQQVARLHVQWELLRRGERGESRGEVIDLLSGAAKDASYPLAGRVAALYALKQLLGSEAQPLLWDLANDGALREFAIRALTDRRSELQGLQASQFIKYLADPSLHVKAQTLIALGRLGDPAAAQTILPLAEVDNGGDRPDPASPNPAQVIPHLAHRALVELRPIEACLEALDGPHRHAALRALQVTHSPAVVSGLLDHLHGEDNEQRRREILVSLMRLYQRERPYDGTWWGIRPDTSGPYYDPVTWTESERIEEVLIAAIKTTDPAASIELLSELKRHRIAIPELQVPPANAPRMDEAIVIAPVDPADPNQIGNMSYEQAVERTLAQLGSAVDADQHARETNSGRSNDVAEGDRLFRSQACVACHTATKGQQPVGPHLQDIGKRLSPRELAESILKPSEKITQGYETQSFLLESGQIVSGFVTSENGREITVRDQHGISHTLQRDQIEQRTRQQVSSMPEGLVGSLKPETLAQLIAYLQSLSSDAER